MRILHTSDWHLGRSLGEFELLDDQARFVDWLVSLVQSRSVELVVIAGDVYDRAVPPKEAEVLFGDAVRAVRAAGAELVVIAGNHDSGERLGSLDGITEAGGLVLRGGYARAGEPVHRRFSDGPLAIVPVPYLEPRLAPPEVRRAVVACGEHHSDPLGHTQVLTHHLAQARAQVGGRRSLTVGHAFVAGSVITDSERPSSVGGAEAVPVEAFDGFSYVALGHLHRPQLVGGRPNVRYSGSPLPFSFSEEHPKSVEFIEMDTEGRVEVHPIEVPVGRAVRTVRGTIDELLALDPIPGEFVRAEVRSDVMVPQAKARLRERFPLIVEVALHRSEHARPEIAAAVAARAEVIATSTPADVVAAFWAEAVAAAPEAGSSGGTDTPTDPALDRLLELVAELAPAGE